MQDQFQERYLAHQKRKSKVLREIIEERHSNRIFSPEPVRQEDIQKIQDSTIYCPSSCDRKAVYTELVVDRDDKNFLGGVLVGGVGWIHRAPAILLLFADRQAYKAGDEYLYMPYLDAGVVIQNLYLTATSMDIHCAYANPNIRDKHKPFFSSVYGESIFCGAFAFGYPK